MKQAILISIGLIVIISCSNEKPQEIIISYIDAHNSHDIENAMTYYDENVEFELKGVWTKRGIKQMSTLEEWDAVMNSNLKLEAITTKGDSVICRVIENNDWFGGVNIADVVHDPTVYIVNNGKIIRIIADPLEETGKEIETALIALYRWSEEVQDPTINGLIINGQFVYSTQAAEEWLDLFKRWNASKNLK